MNSDLIAKLCMVIANIYAQLLNTYHKLANICEKF